MSALTDRIAGVAAARGVPDQAVIDALVKAVKASIAKAYSPDLDVEIGFDAEGSLEAYAFKEIIPDGQSLVNPHKQIRLADARKSLPDLDIGDEYGQPIDVAALEQKALEPGRLEKLFERYGNGRKVRSEALGVRSAEVPGSYPSPLTHHPRYRPGPWSKSSKPSPVYTAKSPGRTREPVRRLSPIFNARWMSGGRTWWLSLLKKSKRTPRR